MDEPHTTLAAPPLSWEVNLSYQRHPACGQNILSSNKFRRQCLEQLLLLLFLALVGSPWHSTTITGAAFSFLILTENLNCRKEGKGLSPSLRAAQLYESVRIRPVVVEEVMPPFL